MVLAQALPLAFHVAAVGGIALGYRLPIVLEVTADPVAALELQVPLARLL
jgi:hypothetical protein